MKTPLTGYGLLAEKHWRQFCPRLVTELEAKGQLHATVAGSGGEDRGGTGLAAPALHPAGVDAAPGPGPGLGDRAGEVHLPAARAGLANEEEWVSFGPAPTEPEPLRNQRNYRITDADHIGAGSLKRKYQDNLAAIELLKQLEADGRAATDREKRVLVRYVGWGGLPQAFNPGTTNGRNSASGWSKS